MPTLNQLANQIEGAKSKARLLEAEKLVRPVLTPALAFSLSHQAPLLLP